MRSTQNRACMLYPAAPTACCMFLVVWDVDFASKTKPSRLEHDLGITTSRSAKFDPLFDVLPRTRNGPTPRPPLRSASSRCLAPPTPPLSPPSRPQPAPRAPLLRPQPPPPIGRSRHARLMKRKQQRHCLSYPLSQHATHGKCVSRKSLLCHRSSQS